MQIMRQIQEALVKHGPQITTLIAREIGKPETDTLIGDVLIPIGSLNGLLQIAPQVLGRKEIPQDILHKTKQTFILREPFGVVGIISPYNYPGILSMQAAFPALISGNSIVHKPSEYAPLTARRLQTLFYEAGLPPDLFQVVYGAADTGKSLVRAGIDHLCFIGKTETGRDIAKAAGERLIPSNLELSGFNVMIVLEDAPIPRAVHGALAYSFVSSGQLCGAARYLYLHKNIAADFIERLQSELSHWTVSANNEPGAGDVTAMAHEEAMMQIKDLVDDALDKGAKLVCGGRRLPGTQAPVYEPTILMDITAEMRIHKEEVFGPVLIVTIIDDEKEAIQAANNSGYGLTASVWTGDDDRAWQIARELQVASVAINDHFWPFFAPESPWGGIKNSGWGRFGGEEGLRAVTYPKVISYERLKLPREVFWYPRPKWLHFAFLLLIPFLYSRKTRVRIKALYKLLTGLPHAQKDPTYRP